MSAVRVRTRPVLVAAAVLALAGCGTTVSGITSGPGGSGLSGSDSFGVGGGAGGNSSSPSAGPGSSGAGTGVGNQGGTGSTLGSGSGTGSGSGSRPATTSGTTTGTGGGGGSTTGGGAVGPGITATTINVGDAYDPDAAAADSALGAANANPGDIKAETDAVVSYINAHGGVAHRKLQVNWYKASVQQDSSTSDEQACSAWTQDHKSFVTISGDPILDQCTANEHAIGVVSQAITQETTAVNVRYPEDINLDGLTNDRAMTYTIEGLRRQGYFAKGEKVGIATWDGADFHYGVTHAALPALAAIGIHNPLVAYITPPQSYGDLGSTSASVSNAVLKFRAAGIDHVLLFDGGIGVNSAGVLVIEWTQQAQSQHYYPRYGLNSTSGFNSLASTYPQRELVNSLGVGWEPPYDEGSRFDPSQMPGDAKLCLKIMDDAGQHQSGGNAVGGQLDICDRYFFIQHVLDSVKGPINQQSALAAVDRLGTSFNSFALYGIDLTSRRHDGAYLARNLAYQSSCSCFKSTSAPYNPGG